MSRTLDLEAHALRRESFVDVAQRHIQAKGYEQMSVQDVLDELGASRGAFYHYFDSKGALLEAVVERMVDGAAATLAPLVADPNVPALEKLEGVFAGLARWKAQRTELVSALLSVWLSDENAIVRDKVRRGMAMRLAPLLAAIVRQGRDEGLFTARAGDDDVARVLSSLIQGANETAVELYVARQANQVSRAVVERTLAAYGEAFERLLGLPQGSLTVIDGAILSQWYGR
jgi:AcrR family transcriptional regulator